jgi:hypothetical protein
MVQHMLHDVPHPPPTSSNPIQQCFLGYTLHFTVFRDTDDVWDRHRRDADYYPRVFSLLVDQLEICAKEDNATRFITTYKDEDFTVDLIGAHEFILRIWEKWDRDGKVRRFRIIPEKYS